VEGIESNFRLGFNKKKLKQKTKIVTHLSLKEQEHIFFMDQPWKYKNLEKCYLSVICKSDLSG